MKEIKKDCEKQMKRKEFRIKKTACSATEVIRNIRILYRNETANIHRDRKYKVKELGSKGQRNTESKTHGMHMGNYIPVNVYQQMRNMCRNASQKKKEAKRIRLTEQRE